MISIPSEDQTIPPKLESTEKFEALLDLLNKDSNRYVPKSDIIAHLGDKFDESVLLYAEGINDRLGSSEPSGAHTTAYLGSVAQIWQK